MYPQSEDSIELCTVTETGRTNQDAFLAHDVKVGKRILVEANNKYVPIFVASSMQGLE